MAPFGGPLLEPIYAANSGSICAIFLFVCAAVVFMGVSSQTEDERDRARQAQADGIQPGVSVPPYRNWVPRHLKPSLSQLREAVKKRGPPGVRPAHWDVKQCISHLSTTAPSTQNSNTETPARQVTPTSMPQTTPSPCPPSSSSSEPGSAEPLHCSGIEATATPTQAVDEQVCNSTPVRLPPIPPSVRSTESPSSEDDMQEDGPLAGGSLFHEIL